MKNQFTDEEKFKIANRLGYSFKEAIKLTNTQIQNILDFGETSIENEIGNQVAYRESEDGYLDRLEALESE